VILSIRVIPRASRTAVAGTRGEALVIRLAAPPVEGAANDELVDFLARILRVPRRDVTIVGGPKSRDKRVRIDTIDDAVVKARLSAILNGAPSNGSR
jgi:uncharacterized protein (TIGR00251 family)